MNRIVSKAPHLPGGYELEATQKWDKDKKPGGINVKVTRWYKGPEGNALSEIVFEEYKNWAEVVGKYSELS